MPFNFDDVVVVGGSLVLASGPEVDTFESRLWIKFPSGYREYMERLGEGCLGGMFVRIYPPWRIEKELADYRWHIQRYWSWDETSELLTKDRAVECVIVGDTTGGDRLIFHPCRPDRLFVLPSDGDGVLDAGSDLLQAIEWMCSSGQLIEPFPKREFEPFDSRRIEEETDGARPSHHRVVDPEGESLDDIVVLGKRWVERHSAREKSSKKLKESGRRWAEMYLRLEIDADNLETELLEEAIILTGHLSSPEGYVLKYSIIDKASGRNLAVFQFTDNGDPYCKDKWFFFPA